MSQAIVSRIYDVKIAGYDDSITKMNAITQAFNKMDAAKKKLNEQLQKKLDAGDSSSIAELTAKIKELEKSIASLSIKKEASAKETALLAQAEKNLALAEKARTANAIQQEREIDRQIALEQKKSKVTQASTGYYYDLMSAQKAAIELYRQTPPTSPLFEQVKQGAIDAKAKVDAFNRSLSPDGTLVGEYKTGILNAFKNLGLSDVLKKNRDDISGQLVALKTQSEQLASEYRKTGMAGTKSFSEVQQQLKLNIEQQERLKQQLNNLDSTLRNTGNIGSQITAGISEGFKQAKQQVAQLVLGYVGFQAIFSGLRQGVGIASELSDQTSNLEVELGKAAGGADKIVTALSKLNTRTKLTVLEDMANIAAKAGVSEDKLVGVVEALDKIKIAFGKDFGDVETGTENLVKLINIFEGSQNVTGENLMKVGNAVRTLANESVASVPYLNDFSKRMAGLKGISDISLPAVLGMASGFEQFGQSSEVAGTALLKVIPKLGTDTEKYAKIAGITQQAFSDLLKSNPAEALIKVSEGLVKSGEGIEDISKAFADSELGSGRIAAVLGTLGSKSEEFRKSIASAGTAYQDTGNIQDAFTAKNQNLASILDKVTKSFADAAGSKTFQITLTAIASVVSLLIGNLGLIIGVLSLYAATWAIANAAMIRARIVTLAANVAFQAQYAWMVIQETVTKAYTASVLFMTGATRGAAAATTLLGNAMRLLPLGVILTLVGVLIAAFKVFGASITGTTQALSKMALQSQALNNVQSQSALIYSKQIAEINSWIAVIKSGSTSADTKAKAVQNLSKINSAFGDVIKGNVVDLKKLDAAYKQVTESIINQANAQASANITAQKQQKVTNITTARQIIETSLAQTGQFWFNTDRNTDIPKEIVDIIKNVQGVETHTMIDFSKDVVVNQKNKNQVLNSLKKLEENATQEFLVYNDLKEKNQVKLTDYIKQQTSNTQSFQVDVGALKTQIEDLDQQINNFKGKKVDLNKLVAEKKKLQSQLDQALGANKNTLKGSSLGIEDKEDIKLIEANRATLLAIENNSVNQIQKVRQLSFKEERDHILKVQKINVDALNAKIDLLNKKKNLNAEEKKQLAEFNEQISSLQLESSRKIYDLQKKEFEEKSQLIKEQLEKQILDAKDANKVVQESTTASPGQKAQSQYETDNAILTATAGFYLKMTALEYIYNQKSKKNADERVRDLKETYKVVEDSKKKLSLSVLDDIEQNTENELTKIKLKYDKFKNEILSSKGSTSDKKEAIGFLEKTQDVELLGARQNGLNESLKHAKELYEAGKITAKEFEEIYAKAIKGQQELNNAIEEGKVRVTTMQGLITKLFGFKEGSENAKIFSELVSQSFDVASMAMNNYYDQEAANIRRNNDLMQRRLDAELEQKKSHAQSQAERDSLDKQYAAKKDKLNREAFEKDKKLKKQQLTTNFAIQLSNIAVAASANPLNPLTFGSAGIAQYIIQAGIATAAYLINLATINKSQYASGGKVKPLPNGRITVRPNIPAERNGDNVLATVKVNEVILNEEQQKLLGGPNTFAAIGVPGFAGGGRIGPPTFGSNLQPPINPGSFLNSNTRGGTEDLMELKKMVGGTREMIDQLARQTNNRIDKLKVFVVSKEIEDDNNERRKATALGTL